MVKGAAGRIIEWVRPHVPESSDGILTSAGICEGFAGAGVGSGVLIFAGFAGLVAGTLAMGTVEYSKLRAERDQQVAQLAKERVQIETAPDAELDELTQLYVSRGLSPGLARQVAIELTAHDALAAHAEAEYGITPASLTSPLRDALAVAAAFAAGAILPWLAMVLVESAWGAVPRLLAVRFPRPTQPGADTRAVESACDLRDRAAGIGVDRLDLGADVGRPPRASDNTHGRCRCSGDADHLHRWSRVLSVISKDGARE
jgi:VIT1/CCC1 family predicted Fe2+/Mn2+ transporter